MAQLHSETISDRMGRKATKSGDEIINVYLYNGNKQTHVIKYEGNTLTVFTNSQDGKKVERSQIIRPAKSTEITCTRHTTPVGNCKSCRFDEDKTGS